MMPTLRLSCHPGSLSSALRSLAPRGAVGLAVLFLAAGCGGGGGGSAAPPAGGGGPAQGAVNPAITRFEAGRTILTQGDSTPLTAEFTGGTGAIDPGVGAVTSTTPVSVTPAVTTTYTLSVTGGSGTLVQKSTTVTVVAPPVLPVITCPQRVGSGQTHCTAKVPGQTDCTYAWTITNGTLTGGSTGPVVTYTAGTAGDLTLTCTVTNLAGQSSQPATATVQVTDSQIADFQASPGVITAGAPVTLTFTFSGGTGRIDPGGLAVTSGTPITVHPAATTLYVLTVTDAGSKVVTDAQTLVTVLPAPDAISITAPSVVSAGENGVTARVPAQPGCTYAWTLTGGTPERGQDTDTFTFTAGAVGTLHLTCTVTNAAGTSLASAPYAIHVTALPGTGTVPLPVPLPVALTVPLTTPASVGSSQEGCTASVPAAADPTATYAWTIANGSLTAGADTRTVTFKAGPAGALTLTCTISNGAGEAIQYGEASVAITGPAITAFACSRAIITAGETAELSYAFSGGNAWLEPLGEEVTSGGTTVVGPLGVGTHTFSLLVSGANGDSAHRALTVEAVPAPAITSFLPDRVVLGAAEATTLTALFDAGPGGTASLTPDLGAIKAGTPLSTGPLATTTVFTLTVTNAAGQSVTATTKVRMGTLSYFAGPAPLIPFQDGAATSARFSSPQGAAADLQGNLYVADAGNHIIRKVTADGQVTTLAGTPGHSGSDDGLGAAASFDEPQGVAVDAQGNVYVADSNNRTIRKITPAGLVTTLTLPGPAFNGPQGQGAPDFLNSFVEPLSLAVEADGSRIYVVDNGDSIRAFAPTGDPATVQVTTLAGMPGASGFGVGIQDGIGSLARFGNIFSLALDVNGNLYTAEVKAGTIRKLSPPAPGSAEYTVSTVAGRPYGRGHLDAPAGLDAQFDRPMAIAVDKVLNLYVADRNSAVLRMLKPRPNNDYEVSTLAGQPYQRGGADGPRAMMESPIGLAVDPGGNVLVVDEVNENVRKVTPAGLTTTLAGPGPQDPGAQATLIEPLGMTVDSAGNLYVADQGSATIHKITPAGEVSTYAGQSDGRAGQADGGALTGAKFSQLAALVMDPAGNLFVSDGTTIRKITPGGEVSTYAGQPDQMGATDGPRAEALFGEVGPLALDRDGNLLVSDVYNRTLRRINSTTGEVTTIAGRARVRGALDGPLGTGTLGRPLGLAVDRQNRVFVADDEFGTIRMLSNDGQLSTVAGDPAAPSDPSWVDGPGASARFKQPTFLTVDEDGNLLVADTGNCALRLVTPQGVVKTLAGLPGSERLRLGPLPAALSGPLGLAVDPATGVIYLVNDKTILRIDFN